MNRITPACAGKTSANLEWFEKHKDHPRLRGENHSRKVRVPLCSGSPPLARGKPECRRSPA